MVGWHHRLNRSEFEQTPRAGKGQGSLICYSPWDHKELDMTEWLNNMSQKILWRGCVRNKGGEVKQSTLQWSRFCTSMTQTGLILSMILSGGIPIVGKTRT